MISNYVVYVYVKSFVKQLSNDLGQHGWFYAEIVGLFGGESLKLLEQ